jgi:hypothetical protein
MKTMRHLILAAMLPIACSSSSDDVNSAGDPLRQLAELACEQAARCGCRFGFTSVSECVETRTSLGDARRYPGASVLHVDNVCAEKWLDALASHGCSAEEPTTPGCYLTYGDVGEGAACNVHDECALGLQCIWGLCQTWGEVDDRCDWDRDCEGADLYCGADWTCRPVPNVGELCDGRCEAEAFCDDGVCTPTDALCGGCDRGEMCRQGSCVTPLELGEACDYYWQCRSETCDEYGNVCVAPDAAICGRVLSPFWL